ncbi:hypothetical protein MP228_008704 [Amoeboaphelidium protococcarum]|nr:hypothetical protein MP228_008704 [Amoeboaphelidium protococcarum]
MPGFVKSKKYDIADSNIALLGSDLEKKVKQNAASSENAWKGVGQQVGINIWRIEDFKVVAWPKQSYGEFYEGDSYIILNTYKKNPSEEKLSYDLHFWLGSETSQDEAGTAAYKTVELDDVLKGAAVQHREVQGHESNLFLSYFKQFKTLNGGVASGFNQVKPEEYQPRLLQVRSNPKNKQNVVVRQVEISADSLNSGDVFILDKGLQIYQFNGKEAQVTEKVKAGEFARALVDQRDGRAKLQAFNEGDADAKPFWDAVGGQKAIKSAADVTEEPKAFTKVLFVLSDASGKLEFKQVASGQIKLAQFDSTNVNVYDSGHEVFVWIGKSASAQEKRNGLQYAQDYLAKYNRPAYLPISRVLEGGENEVFAQSLDK